MKSKKRLIVLVFSFGVALFFMVGGLRSDVLVTSTNNGHEKSLNVECGIHSELILEQIESKDQPVISFDHPGLCINKYGFEGGSTVKVDNVYHLFTAEMSGDPFWVKMRLAYWRSEDTVSWERVRTLYETSGKKNPEDRRFSLWAPMPIYNEQEGYWDMFYVAYRPSCRPDEAGLHRDGMIWRARSVEAGRSGIGGPYEDVEVVMMPDAESQAWEGQQGTDSFYPYKVGQKWYAFYGSHNYIPLGPWQVGFAESDSLTGTWKRMPTGNPCTFDPYFVENPIVTRLEDHYVVIYDSALNLKHVVDGENVGYSCSTDGLDWSNGSRLRVSPPAEKNWCEDVRTPLCLIDEGDGTYTMLYTGKMKGRNFWALGLAKVKATVKKQ